MHNTVRLLFTVYAAGIALSTVVSLRGQAEFRRTHDQPPTRIWDLIRLPRLSPAVFCAVGVAFALALLLAAGGVGARYFGGLAIILYFLYFSQITRLSYISRKTNLVPVILTILISAPGLTAPFSATPSLWPVLAAQAAVACVYLSAGLAKLRNTGPRWASGRQLQAYLFANYLWRDSRLTWRIANCRGLCAAASCTTLSAELLFPLALFSHPLALVLVTVMLAMHLGTHVLMGINYLRYWWPNVLPFVIPVLVLAIR